MEGAKNASRPAPAWARTWDSHGCRVARNQALASLAEPSPLLSEYFLCFSLHLYARLLTSLVFECWWWRTTVALKLQRGIYGISVGKESVTDVGRLYLLRLS